MSANEFVAVNWNSGQLVEEDVLDQMNNNITYLRDQMIDGLYQQRLGGTTTTGLKILCGTTAVPPSKNSHEDITVTFAKIFTPGSYPSITTGIVSDGSRYMFLTMKGIGRMVPDHQGFIGRVSVITGTKAAGRIGKTYFINWQAMGY